MVQHLLVRAVEQELLDFFARCNPIFPLPPLLDRTILLLTNEISV